MQGMLRIVLVGLPSLTLPALGRLATTRCPSARTVTDMSTQFGTSTFEPNVAGVRTCVPAHPGHSVESGPHRLAAFRDANFSGVGGVDSGGVGFTLPPRRARAC